ncbi:MAG: phosphocholine cytidylyltransferase family protein [Planctomycetaceae bacterium]|nr:phosphocholine cytidylyltransferase family protein [Planctomycetaceae bacterium]
MHAIILAAGVANRLSAILKDRPKSMLEFEGRTLLQRHLAILRWAGVKNITIVTGHMADAIKEHTKDFPGVTVSFAHNERYREGSIISAVTGLKAVNDDVILMDADVLYDPEIMQKLVAAKGMTFLLDPKSKETGEEMMLGTRKGRVIEIARKVGADWDEVGETVGFFLFPRDVAAKLLAFLQAKVASGVTTIGYEDALNFFIKEHEARYINVREFLWTEIDYPEDIEKARTKILPTVREKEAKLCVKP